MEFRQLGYFASVVEEGSFTAAARKCQVAQPSLSQQIQKLEEELGETLLSRRPRGVALTESGRSLYGRAKALLRDRDTVLESFHKREALQSGEVALGVIPTIAPYLLGRLLVPFRAQYPEVQVRVREVQTAGLIRMVVDEEVDFAVVSDIAKADRARWSLYVRTVFREPILLAVPSAHPLARSRSGTVRLSEVPKSEILVLSEGHCLRDQTIKVCRTPDANEFFQCEQLPTLQALVAAGLGVAFVPEMFVAEHPASGVTYLRLRDPEPMRAINIMKRRGKKLRLPADSLLKQIADFRRG